MTIIASQTRKVKKSMGKTISSIPMRSRKGEEKKSNFRKNLFIDLT
jgi:hypothetical protein